MNQKEAHALVEVLEMLRRGPGQGWHGVYEQWPPDTTEETLRLWLDTWILPPLERVTNRYKAKS